MIKIKQFSFLCILLGILASNGANADGVGEFVKRLATTFPNWLSENYPNSSYPYPGADAVRVELRQGLSEDDAVEVDVTFYDYRVYNHTRPENWNIYETLVDLSIDLITVDLNLWRTWFRGTYVANGTFNGNPVRGSGSWNVEGNVFIGIAMNYRGVKVTPELYVDLNAGTVEGGYTYIYGSKKEMEDLDASGNEEAVKTLAFDGLNDLMANDLSHPLVAPLNSFMQGAFESTTIPDM